MMWRKDHKRWYQKGGKTVRACIGGKGDPSGGMLCNSRRPKVSQQSLSVGGLKGVRRKRERDAEVSLKGHGLIYLQEEG